MNASADPSQAWLCEERAGVPAPPDGWPAFNRLTEDERSALNAASEIALLRLKSSGLRWPSDANLLFQCQAAMLRREISQVISFDAEFRLIGIDTAGIGSSWTVTADQGAFITAAVLRGATYVIEVHNHPNECCDLSEEDVIACREHFRLFRGVGVVMLDFVVATAGKATFAREEGLVPDCWPALKGAAKASPGSVDAAAERDFQVGNSQPSQEQLAVYDRARAILARFSNTPAALPGEWAAGAFRHWLRETEDWSLAGLALDRGGRMLECRVLVAHGEAARGAMIEWCRFAVQSTGKRFLFAARGETIEPTQELRLYAYATGILLARLELEVMDVLLVAPTTTKSMRECGLIDTPPVAK